MVQRPHTAAGFTLLELLVSITVVSLLALTILFAWRVAAAAWQRANDRLARQRTVLATHQLLQEQMASLVAYPVRAPGGGLELFFQGEPGAARFVSRYSLAHRTRSGFYRIEYKIEEQAGGTRRLLMNEYPVTSREELGDLIAGVEMNSGRRLLQFRPFEERPETTTLLEGLEECRFEYYPAAALSQPAVWTDRWAASANELPQAMAIRAVARAAGGRLRPVSIVAAVQQNARPQQEPGTTATRRFR